MTPMEVNTSAGQFAVFGRLHTGRPRPLLLAINASFSPKGYMHEFAEYFPGVNVLIVNVPGLGGTPWSVDPSPKRLANGVREIVEHFAGDLPLVVYGASTGNLVTLSLDPRNIFRIVSVEPFFQTQDLWPFIRFCRKRRSKDPADVGLRAYVQNMFGFHDDRVENRDYRALRDGVSTPMDVVCGQTPLLPEREISAWPSFTSDEDRAALRQNPAVILHEGPPGSGHSYGTADDGTDLVKRLLHTALLGASQKCI